jgi:NAD(P)-dependent dehydrogenase (short-subunit alcohol dehydrogenase family)
MLHCILSPAAALLASGVFFVSSLAAQAQQPGGEQKPPEQAQGEQKQEGKPEGQQKADEQAKAEQEAAAKSIQEYREAAAKLSSSAGSPECVWTGRRIASLLWRDDVDTARRYIDLYDRFNCSAEHLKLAFRCIIDQGPLDPKAADKLASRVHNCWIAPQGDTTASSQATVGTTTKAGTIPN